MSSICPRAANLKYIAIKNALSEMKSKALRAKSKTELKRRIKRSYRSRDAHKEMYGKEYHEVEYRHVCPVCGSRVDEKGMCACGAGDS